MSLRRICSLSVQSLKHLRFKNKNKIQSHARPKNRLQSQNPTQSHKPEQREERRTCEFVRSAAKRSSDSRASAPLRGRSESGLAYPLRPESSLSSPQHTDLHKTLDTCPTARCPILPKKPLNSPSSQGLHNPTKKIKLKRPHSSTVLLGAPQPK
jgi:hypothetical protein